MENGYQILCFEHGARPSAEVFDACRCYAYEVFVEGILQGIVARQLRPVLDEYTAEENLLILDIQKADGRPETMNLINEVLRGRCKKQKPTFLVGENVPQPVLDGIDGIKDDVVFITEEPAPDYRDATGKAEGANGL